MGFAISVDDLKDYKDILPAPGKYQVEITKGKDGFTQKGRGKIDLNFKVLDTIPAGEEIDEEQYENPIDSTKFATIYLPTDGDAKNTQNMFNGRIRDWLNNFEVEASDPNELTGKDFVDCVGGVIIKHEKRDKNDPNSPMQARIENSCPLD